MTMAEMLAAIITTEAAANGPATVGPKSRSAVASTTRASTVAKSATGRA